MIKRQWRWLVGLCLAAGVLFLRYRRQILRRLLHLPPLQAATVRRRRGQVAMADGVRLAVDHYYPQDSGPNPTILLRTPYNRKRMGFFAQRFAERGYHVIVQDTRGRFASEGVFAPRLHEQADGVETVRWIRQQNWSDGRVGMWGQSYMGYVQWAAATEAPDGLLAIVPAITTASGRGMFYSQGIFSLEFVLRWLLLVDGMDPLPGSHRPFWKNYLRALPFLSDYFLGSSWNRLPLRRLDQRAVGHKVDFFQAYLDHSAHDHDYWRQVDFHDQIATVVAAAHFISGWYDFMLQDFLADYAAYPQEQRPYLTIGAWHHFDYTGYLAMLRLGIDWFDAYLRGQDRRRTKPVRLFVMGAEEWRDYESWPPPAEQQRWYPGSDGRLHPAPSDSAPAYTSYRYDPADPTPSVGGTIFNMNQAGAVDNRSLAARLDVLRFDSPPLPELVTVIGPVAARFYAHSTAETADFFARLCVQKNDGRLLNLCDGIIRLTAAEMEGDTAVPVMVEMWATAYQFQPGERICLLIASGAHPRWARNLGWSGPVGDMKAQQPALQTIYHDRERPAVLILPVVTDLDHDEKLAK